MASAALALTYAKARNAFETGVPDMAYQLKDQDVTPPAPHEVNQRSVAADGIAALVMVLAAIGLITLILSQVID